MITVDMTSPEIDRQLELLKFYPEVVAKHYRPALSRIVQAGEAFIRPLIPVGASGTLSETFRSKVSGRAITSIKGQIGWMGDKNAWYAQIVEAGAVPHTIEARGNRISKRRADAGGGETKAMRWMDGGQFVFSKKVNHPGFSKRGFMAAGMSFIEPVSNVELQTAGEMVLHEMEIK